MPDTPSFLGRGWDFPPTFVRGDGARTIADAADVASSLAILLSTDVGERRMQPTYGCDLKRLVFEPVDATLQAYMRDLIRTAILYFEPRVILHDVVLEPQPYEGRIDIRIDFTIAGTNTRRNFVYPFYKLEGTEVQG
jgi:hypothetical protein